MKTAIIYLCLIVSTLLALITRAGFGYFHQGVFFRGTFYLLLSALSAGAWVEPLVRKTKRSNASSTRMLLLLLVSWSAYELLREHLLGWLPRL